LDLPAPKFGPQNMAIKWWGKWWWTDGDFEVAYYIVRHLTDLNMDSYPCVQVHPLYMLRKHTHTHSMIYTVLQNIYIIHILYRCNIQNK
jgi:hypothetical protein